jgi:dolichol kinase
LEVLLDEAFVIPGTNIRFGIDGIIGLVPGLGDVLAGLLSLLIPFAAWVRGLPYVTVVRMLINVAIGLLVGSVPILGDAFDIFWKANRRNYRLLSRSIAEPRRHTWRDWVFLLVLGFGIAVLFAIPLALAGWLILEFFRWQPY